MLAGASLDSSGLRPRGPLSSLPSGAGASKVFRSPMTTVRFRAAIMRSLFPSGLFNASLDLLQVRLARGSSLVPVCPASAISTPLARCPDFCPSIPVSPRISASPSGFVPLRITAFRPICDRKARLPKQPDVRCSPPGRYAAGRSSLRTRYCFGGWLFLKPLGTDSILSLADLKVNRVLRS